MYAEASSPKCWKKIIQKTQPTNSLKMWQSLDIYVWGQWMQTAFIRKLKSRSNFGNICNHSDQYLWLPVSYLTTQKLKKPLCNYNFVVSQGMAGPFWICQGKLFFLTQNSFGLKNSPQRGPRTSKTWILCNDIYLWLIPHVRLVGNREKSTHLLHSKTPLIWMLVIQISLALRVYIFLL